MFRSNLHTQSIRSVAAALGVVATIAVSTLFAQASHATPPHHVVGPCSARGGAGLTFYDILASGLYEMELVRAHWGSHVAASLCVEKPGGSQCWVGLEGVAPGTKSSLRMVKDGRLNVWTKRRHSGDYAAAAAHARACGDRAIFYTDDGLELEFKFTPRGD